MAAGAPGRPGGSPGGIEVGVGSRHLPGPSPDPERLLDTIPVIAAVIRRGPRFLLGRRPDDKRHGGLWEFPGGKVHEGEALLAAADRELAEELSMRAVSAGPVLLSASDGSSPFVIHFVEIEAEGEPEALEHSDVGWFTPEELAEMELAPADARFVRWLLEDAAGDAQG